MTTPAQAGRIAIVCYSLGITGCLMLFLLLAQPIGMRFDYLHEQNLRLIDVVLPTFLGYLGAASHFLFNANRGREVPPENVVLLRLLIHGPFVIFIIVVVALFVSYYISHRPLTTDEPRVDQMSFESLSRYLSICLGLLAATVGVISSYLFGVSPVAQRRLRNTH